jgi:hypothetical protein
MSRTESHPDAVALSSHLDGDGEPLERGRVAAHLEACPECRELASELRRLTDRLAAHPDRPPPRDLWPDLAARIRAEQPRPAGPRAAWWRAWRARPLWLAPAAGLLVLVLAVGLRLVERSGGGDEGVPPGSPAATAPAGDASVALYREAAEAMRERLAEEPLPERVAPVVEAELAAYDRAVVETSAALARAPDDPELRAHLLRTLEAQVRFLRRVDESVDTLL